MDEVQLEDRLAGLLLGTAVGDALGLPCENLSVRRRRRLFPGPAKHRFLLGRGMISDDTEHTLFVGQSLLGFPDDVAGFQRNLARRFRGWFLALPAGLGKATLRSCLKLCLGWPSGRSGVYSAGNGAAMRSALIGAYFHDRPDDLDSFVCAASEITHRDPRAIVGALAVAHVSSLAVGYVSTHQDAPTRLSGASKDTLLDRLASLALDDSEWQRLIEAIGKAADGSRSVQQFATELGLERGVTGYVYHTVPFAIYAWLQHYGDFRATIEAVLDCGGDTDTVGAIAGAMAGATCGAKGIPNEWVDSIWEWPRSVKVLREVARRLASQKAGEPQDPVSYFWPAVFPRNLFFLAIVLLHGFRRLAPPY